MGNGKTDTIMEFASGKIVSIDHQKKQYSEMTVAEMDEAMKAMAAQMEQTMAQVPPQMREQMAKMMGGGHGARSRSPRAPARPSRATPARPTPSTMGTNMTQETCNSTALTPALRPRELPEAVAGQHPHDAGHGQDDEEDVRDPGHRALAAHHHEHDGQEGGHHAWRRPRSRRAPSPPTPSPRPPGYKQVESPLKKMGKMGR